MVRHYKIILTVDEDNRWSLDRQTWLYGVESRDLDVDLIRYKYEQYAERAKEIRSKVKKLLGAMLKNRKTGYLRIEGYHQGFGFDSVLLHLNIRSSGEFVEYREGEERIYDFNKAFKLFERQLNAIVEELHSRYWQIVKQAVAC